MKKDFKDKYSKWYNQSNYEFALKQSSVRLEKAKYEDPWKLITNPTLNYSPVSISKKKKPIFFVDLGVKV